MNKITFRSITPAFEFALEPEESVFSHSGKYENADFDITLRRFPHGQESFDELMKYSHHKDKHTSIHLPPGWLGKPTYYFLVIDVNQEALEVAGNTKESNEIGRCILDALRLVSSKGFKHYQTYNFTSTDSPMESSQGRAMTPYLFTHIGRSSLLQKLQNFKFKECRSVFDKLLSNSTADPNLELVLEYHITSFCLPNTAHCFLLLMVVFEALFKLKDERNSKEAAARIAKVIENTSVGRARLRRQFYSNKKSFSKLRNSIAHGDTDQDTELIKTQYPILYDYITRAMIDRIV